MKVLLNCCGMAYSYREDRVGHISCTLMQVSMHSELIM